MYVLELKVLKLRSQQGHIIALYVHVHVLSSHKAKASLYSERF